MGCTSAKFVVQLDVPGQDRIAEEVFSKLLLTPSEINSFYGVFLQMKKTSEPYVHRSEIASYFKIEEGDLTNRIFDLFAYKSGKLDFCQFLCTMWNFLSIDAQDLSSFAFILFDHDNSQTLAHQEIVKLIETIHKKKCHENAAVAQLCEEIALISRNITLKQFLTYTKVHPSLCGPLAALQFSMRKTMLGDRFWSILQARRNKHSDQSNARFLMKLLAYTRKKYEKVELDRKVKEIYSKRQQKIDEMTTFTSKQQIMERKRNDDMLNYFKGGTAKKKAKYFHKSNKSSSSSSLKLNIRKDHESDDEDAESDDNADEQSEENNDEEDKVDDEGDTAHAEANQTKTLSQSTSPRPMEPQVISSTMLRKTLIIKQNSTDSGSSASSARKTLFQPASIPRRTMINGVARTVVPMNDPVKSTSADQEDHQPATSPPPSTSEQTAAPKPRKTMVATATSQSNSSSAGTSPSKSRQSIVQKNSAPLPAITSARKTMVQSSSSSNLQEKPPPLQKRPSKLEPIKR